jgi:predicted RNA-binding protein
MCEFKVLIDGKSVFKDVVFVKVLDEKIIVKTIMGEVREFDNVKISVVDVNTQVLALISTKKQ